MPSTILTRTTTPTLVDPAAPRLSRDELTNLVRRTVLRQTDWRHLVRLPEGQDRWWTRLDPGTPDADLWLLTWLPGHATELHDHGDSAASFAVVAGELAEIRIERGRTARTTWHPGRTTWLAPGVVHDVVGAGSGPAVSVHAYSPPLTRMTYYDADTSGGLGVVRSVSTDQPEEVAE